NQKSIRLLFVFIWYKLPEFILLAILVATLVSAALALGHLWRRNEILALITSGLSYYRVILSILLFALILVPLVFIFQDRVLSRSNFQAEEIWNLISDRPVRTFTYLNRYWMKAKDSPDLYHYDLLEPRQKLIRGFLLLIPEDESPGLKRLVFARLARIDGQGLILQDGWERTFSGASSRLVSFNLSELQLPEAENYFLKEWKEPETMNLTELKKYSQDLEKTGTPATRFRLAIEFRKAFSFSILILVLFALSAVSLTGARGFLLPLGLSLAGGFVYWQVIAIFRSLGMTGLMPIFLSVWGPQLMFFLVGVYFLLKGRT
ncbi:MAG: LptF/LptG family permease, partial [Candidatus Saccharicenans sp.]